MKKRYYFGGISFDRKADCDEYIRDMISEYEIGQELNPEDFNFIFGLLQNHERVKEKIGPGIKAIRKIRTSYGTDCFELIRTDGSKTDFSWVKCVYPVKDRLIHIKSACRHTVHNDIRAFREREFSLNADSDGCVKCPLTGERVYKENSHVDHAPPMIFDEIVRQWLETIGIELEDIEITGFEDGSIEKSFSDRRLQESFRAFHSERASLRILSKQANLRQPKKY